LTDTRILPEAPPWPSAVLSDSLTVSSLHVCALAACIHVTLAEREVLRLVVDGLSNKEIGNQLHLVDSTVKNRLWVLMSKLGVSTRTQLAVAALRTGLVH
jgi:DNA-binding NarL/FixJ family response regulator